MAIPPPDLSQMHNDGTDDDPYVIAYMSPAAWLHELHAMEVNLSPSPAVYNALIDYSPSDCVQVEVRFRALVEAEELKWARRDNQPPLPELRSSREEAHQSLRDALTILCDLLQKNVEQDVFGADNTLADQKWWTNSCLNCVGAPPDTPLRRVLLEQAIRSLERGARHLTLPASFWQAMLVAVDHLGLIGHHHRYQDRLQKALKNT
jgi:hypothetical protein